MTIEEKLKRRARIETRRGYEVPTPEKFVDLEKGDRYLDPDERSIAQRGEKIGDWVFEDIAKRGLVVIEIVKEDERQLRILEAEPFPEDSQRGIYKLAVLMSKRMIGGDGKKKNFLLVHSAPALIDPVIELGTDDLTQASTSYYRKEIDVHVAGIVKRIAFICKTVGSGGTSFAYRVYNLEDVDERDVRNIIYENTGNSAPSANSFPVDRAVDYPYSNKEKPKVAKLYIEIEIDASASGWEWLVIIDSEERCINTE